MITKSKDLYFQLVSPEKILFSGTASLVIMPAAKGEIGILPHHAPMILTLQSGLIKIYKDDTLIEKVFVAGGFAEVLDEGCSVMADDAIHIKDINPEELEAYIEQVKSEITTIEEKDERALLEQSVTIARNKVELFRRLQKYP